VQLQLQLQLRREAGRCEVCIIRDGVKLSIAEAAAAVAAAVTVAVASLEGDKKTSVKRTQYIVFGV
jgi:hypothetical protein